jgi:acetolactate synthase small subunit
MLFSDQLEYNGERFAIPGFIRLALALNDNASLFATAFRAGEPGIVEIDLTPIPHDAWQDTWRLEATIQNRSGALARLTKVLTDRKIDIVLSRGVTIQRDTTFQMDLHLNLSHYESQLDGTISQRRHNPLRPVNELRAEIGLCLLHYLEFVTQEKPMLSLRRNLALFRAYHALEDRHSCLMRKGVLECDKVLRERIRKSLSAKKDGASYYVVGDEDNSVVRIYVVAANSPFVHFRVVMQDGVGVMSKLTSSLFERGINIYQVFARPGPIDGRCLVDMMVRVESSNDVVPNVEADRGVIADCIKTAFGPTAFEFVGVDSRAHRTVKSKVLK